MLHAELEKHERIMKRARDLAPGEIVIFHSRPLRAVAEVKRDIAKSHYYPYRPYKIVRVRWEGDNEFTWKGSLSNWVVIVGPMKYQGRHRAAA